MASQTKGYALQELGGRMRSKVDLQLAPGWLQKTRIWGVQVVHRCFTERGDSFYPKCFLLWVLASEAARQLMSFFWLANQISHMIWTRVLHALIMIRMLHTSTSTVMIHSAVQYKQFNLDHTTCISLYRLLCSMVQPVQLCRKLFDKLRFVIQSTCYWIKDACHY